MEKFTLGELNLEQRENLAKLFFDIAKGAFLISFFPATFGLKDIFLLVVNVSAGLIAGIAFTYLGLLILKQKMRINT